MTYALSMIVLVAAVTALTRFLPFWLFGGKRGMPAWVGYLGRALPPAIIAALVVYCLKDAPALGAQGLIMLGCAALVALLQSVWRSTLISIGVGTAAYMILIRLL